MTHRESGIALMVERKKVGVGRLGVIGTGVCMLGVLLSGGVAQEDADPRQEPGGKLEEVSEKTRKLLNLQWQGSGVRIDRGGLAAVVGEQPKAVGNLAAAFGCKTAGMRTVGNEIEATLSSETLEVRMLIQNPGVRVTLHEEKPPGRTLDIVDEGDGAVEISLSRPSGEKVLVLSQSANGKCQIFARTHGKEHSFSGDSYFAVYRGQRDWMEQDLFPILRGVGITPPMALESFIRMASDRPEVVQVAFNLICPLTVKEKTEADRLLRQLSDSDFAVREQAEKSISERFARLQVFVEDAASDNSLSLDTSERIRSLVGSHPEQAEARRFINAGGLLGDPCFLIPLMAKARTEGQRRAVAEALERCTKQDLGTDLSAWEKWWGEQKSRTEALPKEYK